MKTASLLLLVLISTAAAQYSARLHPDEERQLTVLQDRYEARRTSRQAAQVALKAALASEAVAKQEYDSYVRHLCESRQLRATNCRLDLVDMSVVAKGRK